MAAAFWVSWALLLIQFAIRADGLVSYSMNDDCGKTIDMGIWTNFIKIYLTEGAYDRNMDCGIHIRSLLFKNYRFLIQIPSSDIECGDKLRFYDGPTQTYPELGNGICGTGSQPSVVSTGSDLYIRFTSDSSIQGEGFSLLINTFHTDTFCSSSEFSCSNGRCIGKDLYCNDHDNCGDNSDYCYKDENWWIWMIVGIVCFLVLCVVVTVVCCCLCSKKTQGTVIKTNNAMTVHYQNAPQAGAGNQINPWYGPPAQQTGPQAVQQYPYPAPTMPQPPSYTPGSGSSVYPPPQPAASGISPPPYSDKGLSG